MGRGSINNPIQYKDQNYKKLHKSHVEVKKLFSDPVFPAIFSSIGNFSDVPTAVEWKRPPNLCESPHLLGKEISPADVVPGKLGSRWFVSACSILAGIGELCHKVIPEYWKQEWDPEKKEEYAGIFHFRFWRFGQWVDVVVDDLLPTFENEILVTHSSCPNEFWISLLEKAYAKLHGSYEALEGGHLADALVDFTGGVSEVLHLNTEGYAGNLEKQASLFSLLSKEISSYSIVCAVVMAVDNQHEGARTDVGLHVGHAYAISAVKKVHLGESGLKSLFKGREKIAMVRLRDPNGTNPVDSDGSETNDDILAAKESCIDPTSEKSSRPGTGWNYAYSTSKLSRLLSKNPEWAKVKDSEKHRIGLVCDIPGEFWLPLEDFVSNFSEVTICRLFNTNIFALSKTWKEGCIRGAWSTGARGTSADRSGGSASCHDTFFRNPQYMFDVKVPEEEVVIQMLQWDTTVQCQSAGVQTLLIAFYIIKVEENRKYRLHKQWDHTPTVVSCDPIRKRDIFYRGYLSRGRYIIIPATHKPGDIGGYLIRTFTASNINLREIKRDGPRTHCYCCTSGSPILVTVVNIKGAEDLKFDSLGSCDPFCVIKCEGKKEKTHILRNTTHPKWDSAFVFYRSKTEDPIVIKVYNHNTCLPDSFSGEVLLPASVNQQPTLLRAELKGGKNEDSVFAKGKLVVQVYTNDNFMMV